MSDSDRVKILHDAIARYFERTPASDAAQYETARKKVEGLRKAFNQTGGNGPLKSAWLELGK